MARTARSRNAGQNSTKPPKGKAKVETVATNHGTYQRLITYRCPLCGDLHRVIELGYRRAACKRGMVHVVAGGGR